MEGTYILHSKTASKNGGDFDFDTICVMPSDQFPKFVAGRIAYGERFRQEKTKHQKAKSPWWNACPVAMKARGNRIGSITDLKTSCLAAGRPDLAYKLVEQLQNALDSLKHRVEIDESVVSEIRKEVAPAPWLRYKRERRVSDLPAHLEVADTDKVGRLYNVLRKEVGFLPDETGNGFEEKMAIEDFRGLFSGENVTKEMFEECQLVNSIYGDIASRIVQREDEVKQQLKDAQAQWEAVRGSEDKETEKVRGACAKQGAGGPVGTRTGCTGSIQLLASVRSLLGARQAGESSGMGAGDEYRRHRWLRFRRGSLPVVSAGGDRCLCGGHRWPAGTRATAEDCQRLCLVRR